VAVLKHAVDDALAHKAQQLQHADAKSTNQHRLPAYCTRLSSKKPQASMT
jgi:hypothetical protein